MTRSRRHRLSTTYGIAVLLSALVAAIAPASASALEKGLQTDLTWGISAGDQDRTMAGVGDLGARWMRLTMAWHDIETRKGSYSGLARYDQAIADANAAGVKLIVAVHSSPDWASGSAQREAPPLNPADFADFMGYIAARYTGKVDAWELWNEPNTQTFWPTGQNPAHYALMLKAGYPAVKASDPAASVVFAGTWNNDYEFLESAYQAVPNLGDYFDVLGTHPYVGSSAPDQVWNDPNGRISKYSFAGYREMRQTMVNHGDDKPIWFTEFGWATYNGDGGVSEATQAEYLSRAYQCAEQDSYVQVAIWYAYRNHHTGGDAQGWEQQLGLTRTDFSQKPAYGAFKSYSPGSGSCGYGPPASPAPDPAPTTPRVPTPTTPPAPTTPTVTTPTTPTLSTLATREVTSTTGTPTGVAAAAPQLLSPMLSVRRTLVRDGVLVIDGRVASTATGTVRGVATYGPLGTRKHQFAARVGSGGTIRIREQLPNGTDASAATVALIYTRNGRFHTQWVVLQAAERSAKLRVQRDARSSLVQTHTIRGTVAPEARGSVVLALTYRTADGRPRSLVRRSRIRGGEFRRALSIPSGARQVILYVAYAGDPARGIGGGTTASRLSR